DAVREMQTAREEGRAQNERWHARKDGSIFYGSGSVMPLRDKSGGLKGFVKIMRDLTESKRNEEALRQHLDELTRFNAVAVGGSDFGAVEQIYEMMERQVEHMVRLVDDLMEVSRI